MATSKFNLVALNITAVSRTFLIRCHQSGINVTVVGRGRDRSLDVVRIIVAEDLPRDSESPGQSVTEDENT